MSSPTTAIPGNLAINSLEEIQSKRETLESALAEIDALLSQPETIRNSSLYSQKSKEYSKAKEKLDIVMQITKLFKNQQDNSELLKIETNEELIEMAQTENSEIETELITLTEKLAELEEIKDPYDDGNAIIEIRAGTGGDEAAIFVQDMFRAYSKFAESMGFRAQVANISYGGTAGFKEIVFFVEGDEAYKMFKFESGVHRVQRVPATESSGRIHTSAVSVVVLPEIPETEVNIDPKDLRIDVYRAGGPGGQSVNTTDSAVRIVHIPSGIVVTCQDEKSQHKNKAKALKILQAKLFDIAQAESAEKLGNIRQAAIKTGDRSAKIRTYNYPQSRVTDHRIKESWHNLSEIMEGNFQEITKSLQKYIREHKQFS